MPNYPDPNVDLREILRLAGTDAGRQLIAMLRRQNGPALEEGLRRASAGDYGPLQRTVTEFLSDPAARELARKLRGQAHG